MVIRTHPFGLSKRNIWHWNTIYELPSLLSTRTPHCSLWVYDISADTCHGLFQLGVSCPCSTKLPCPPSWRPADRRHFLPARTASTWSPRWRRLWYTAGAAWSGTRRPSTSPTARSTSSTSRSTSSSASWSSAAGATEHRWVTEIRGTCDGMEFANGIEAWGWDMLHW